MAKQTIIIAATHRSGSYHFCDLLSKFAGIPLPEEHLNFDLLYARDQLGLGQDAPIEQVLQTLVDTLGVNDLFTMKAMWSAYASVFRKIANEKEVPLDNWPALAQEIFPDSRYIFIRRKNKVGQAVSFYKALLTGVWRFERETSPYASALLTYDFRQIRDRLKEIETMEAGWEWYFQAQQIPYLEIWHEDFVADRLGVLQTTCEFLGLEPAMAALPETRFVRAPNDVNADWTRRYQHHAALMASPADQDICLPAESSGAVVFQGVNPAAPQAGTLAGLTFALTNTSSQTWPEVGLDQDNGWIELRLTLSADGEIKQRACLGIYENLSPGTTTEISMPIELPVAGGTYDGVAELVQLGVGTLGPSARFRLVIGENPIFGGLNRLLPGWCSTDVPEWKQVPGLGKIKVDQYPWIYHPEHGWQYIHEESSQPGKLTLHDEHMGWLYVQLQNYPENIQCLQDKTWVRYDGTRDGLRTFVRKDSGQPLGVPKNTGKAKP